MKFKAFYLFLTLFFASVSQVAAAEILEDKTQIVVEAFTGHDVKTIANYCEDKVFAKTCGQLVTFKGTKSFMYNFASLERQVGATVYYVEKENGRFMNVLDEIFDSKVGVDKAFDYNDDLVVEFDKDGRPTVKNVKVIKHGTSNYVLSDLIVGENGLDYVGHEFDTKDPEYKVKKEVHYNLSGPVVVNPPEDLAVVKNIKKLFSEEKK